MPRVSDEQIEQAKSIDLLSYLQRHEPQSIRKSGKNEYCLVEHDSLKISNGKFHWFSRGIGGYGALDYLIKVCGMEFVDVVNSLTDGETSPIYQSERAPPKITSQPKPPKPFALPPANVNNDKVIAYLRGRGIGKDIINRCIGNETLYESANSHRCVFVGMDGDTPKFACQRGTTDDYKKDVSGSDKRFSFTLPPETAESRNLAIFESAIDVLSHHRIYEMGKTAWDGYRLSLGGVSSLALISSLERHTNVNSILLCLDSDKAGKDATNRIIKELLTDKRFSHIKITIAPPSIGNKDYNDTLQAVHQLNKEKIKESRRSAVFSI